MPYQLGGCSKILNELLTPKFKLEFLNKYRDGDECIISRLWLTIFQMCRIGSSFILTIGSCSVSSLSLKIEFCSDSSLALKIEFYTRESCYQIKNSFNGVEGIWIIQKIILSLEAFLVKLPLLLQQGKKCWFAY